MQKPAEQPKPVVEPKPVEQPKPAIEPKPVEQPKPAAETRPAAEAPKPLETGTLAKILKEAEDIKEEQKMEGILKEIEEEDLKPEIPKEEPAWDIASTLAKLEAIENGNEQLGREMRELDEISSAVRKASPEINEGVLRSPANGSEDRVDPDLLSVGGRSLRRYGVNNRNTNRAGKTFTEEELFNQIRD